MTDQTNPAAARTASHLAAAIESIDGAFGDGHAAANPALVAAFLQSASIETAILSGEATVQFLDTRIDRSTERVCKAMENLRPRIFG
jgi:hypothetical protein